MQDQSPGLIDALYNLVGGAAATIMAAFTGRLMYLSGHFVSGRRRVFSVNALWELPTIYGMALIGDGLSDYFDWSNSATIGATAVLSYLGPRGAGAILERWIAKRTN